jgi:predicted DNA-binding protein (UPF0251 family)
VRRPARDAVALDAADISDTLVAASNPTASFQLRELEKALARLRPEEREVILLIGLEGMRYHEAAKILGVPISTVRSRLSTGRDRLRRMMEMTNDEMLSTAPHLQNAKPHAPHRYSGFAAPRRVTPFRAHCDFGSFVAVLEGGCPQ